MFEYAAELRNVTNEIKNLTDTRKRLIHEAEEYAKEYIKSSSRPVSCGELAQLTGTHCSYWGDGASRFDSLDGITHVILKKTRRFQEVDECGRFLPHGKMIVSVSTISAWSYDKSQDCNL